MVNNIIVLLAQLNIIRINIKRGIKKFYNFVKNKKMNNITNKGVKIQSDYVFRVY